MLRLTEGEGSAQVDHAEGRFVFLRAFSDDVEVPLRVGSLRVYRLPAARRQLFQAEPAPEPEPQPAPEPAPQPRPAPALNETVVRAIARLRNLTKDSCLAAQREDHEAARRDRTRAALLWGSLEPDVFNGTGANGTTANGSWACWDCMRNRPGSCLHFFAWTPPPPSEAKLRRRRELQAEQQKAHRRRSLEQLMGKSCCRVHRATGAKDCSPSYCVEAVKQHAHARMAHTLRRLHDAGKREETKLSVVQLVATDVLSPRTAHPHAPCKKGDLHAGSAECLAESMIHHALGAHGATREQVDEHLSKVGVTLGSAVARMLGATRQTAAAAPSWRSDPQRAAAAAKAGRPRRRAQQGAPRRAARHEQASREERARLREASSWLNASAHHASALVRAGERNAASRGHLPAQGVLSASVDAMARVFTSPDSLLGRSVAAGRALTEVLARRPALAGPPRPPRPRPHRRLIASFYDHVDAAEGRRLAAGSPGGGFDLPVRPSWIHRVDWPAAVHELHRVAGVLQTRTKHVHDHVRRLGQLPHGELLDRHKTGWSLLDINVVPTSVGNGFRRLHAYMHGRAHDRDLHYQTRTLPRATDSSHRQAAADALLHGEGFFAAAQNHLEHSNSHHRSRARRLADSFFEAAQALPVTASAIRSAFAIDALVDDEGAPLLDSGGRPVRGFAKSGASDGGVEFVRWLVEDTLLCYLYDPHDGEEVREFGDGTGIKTHRSRRLCWPAIAGPPVKLPPFREALGLDAEWKWNDLEYESACNSEAVKGVLASLGEPVPWNAGPYALILRAAEGVDALNNIARTADGGLDGRVRASALVCGIAQLGGLLFTIMATSAALLFCACAPLGSAVCMVCWRTCRRRRGAQMKREHLVDLVLDRAGKEGWLQVPDDDDEEPPPPAAQPAARPATTPPPAEPPPPARPPAVIPPTPIVPFEPTPLFVREN